MSQSYTFTTVLKTLDAVLDTIDEIKNVEVKLISKLELNEMG